jgi:hypothetical protein
MKTSKTKTIKTRTWYGMEATVTIGPGFLHKVGFKKLLIPHPPVVNWLLRRGLTENARSSLSFTHEIGHLESGPLAVFYAAVNLAVIYSTGQANLAKIILVFISTHAAWEIISEIFTIIRSGDLYRKHYERVTIIPRTIFWTFAIVLTLVGWIIALP